MLTGTAARHPRTLLGAALFGLAFALGGGVALAQPDGLAAAGSGIAATDPAQDAAPMAEGSKDAPVIAAPRDPARMAPSSSSSYVPADMGGFNSFAAGDPAAAPPPLDAYGLQADATPVVVELFTSQGCSSCPPADAMLAGLADAPDILPLSFHVDYWDYLGWADSFARPEFTVRQERYAQAAGERSVYTPQIIVDGRDTAVSLGPAQLMALIDASRLSPAMLSVQRDTTAKGEVIELMPLSDLGGEVEILLVRYAPRREVRMTAGENRGKAVTYTNVVLSLDRLAEWDGVAALRVRISPDGPSDDSFPADTRHALLVQKERHKDMPGPILAAIRLD